MSNVNHNKRTPNAYEVHYRKAPYANEPLYVKPFNTFDEAYSEVVTLKKANLHPEAIYEVYDDGINICWNDSVWGLM